MEDPISRSAYEELVAAAETHRAALVVRLAGEVGLRTAEIVRIRPRDLRASERVPGAAILSIPAFDDDRGTDAVAVDREAFVRPSVATALRRYADVADVGDNEPFIDVSPRRVQMVVSETAERAAALIDDPSLSAVTPRDLRRAFTRWLLDRGIDTHVVREAGGWGSMDALDPYLDPLDGEAIGEAVTNGIETPDLPGEEGTSRSADGERASREAGDDDPTSPRRGSDGFDETERTEWRVLFDAFAAIPSVADRDSLFATVAERLVAGDRWRAAWVVRGTAAEDHAGVDVTAAAGLDDGDDPVFPPVPDARTPPWVAAIRNDTPVVARVTEAGVVPERAAGPDAESFLAVPVTHEDATHGALCLRSRDGPSVSAAEREAVAVLGRCLGWGVTAGRWRDLLHSDAITEVEFRVTSDDAFLAAASDALDCRIEFESMVAVSATSSRCFFSVSGAGPQAFADAVEAADGASEPRVLETREEGCSVSVRISGGSLVYSLTEHGATVRNAVATNGRASVVADLPAGADVRSIAEGLRRTHSEVKLLSKESVTRSPHTESTLRSGVADRLTDRQWATLSAAYHSGYFDWPRGSTAEEVADSMEVSSPTFHNHLRKAQRALLDTLFEAGNGR